jgi:two-component system, OmpR family, sensor histidine kinase VanS
VRHNITPGARRSARAATPPPSRCGSRTPGRGFSADAVAQLAEPFLRGAGRTARGDGYGLGLALVSRIATLHDGTLALAPRDGGELIATVTLPGGRARSRSGS